MVEIVLYPYNFQTKKLYIFLVLVKLLMAFIFYFYYWKFLDNLACTTGISMLEFRVIIFVGGI